MASALLLIGFAWLVIKLCDRTLEALAVSAPRARFFFKALIPILRFGLSFLVAYWVIHLFAPTPEAMIAVTASAGIAIGLGAQDLVKNIIGGIIILTDRPYQLGDRVLIGDAYGEIDHIGLRSTKMTNADDTRITIPNSEILTGRVWNSNSGVPDAQVSTDLYLPHNCDPHLVLRIATEAAYSSPFLYAEKPVTVVLSDQISQTPYLRVRVKAYVYDHRFEPKMQHDITMRAKAEFRRQGVY